MFRACVIGVVVLLVSLVGGQVTDPEISQAGKPERVRVIVEFADDAPWLRGAGRSSLIERMSRQRQEVIASLPMSLDVVREFDGLPGFVAEVDASSVGQLERHPQVRSVRVDRELRATLLESGRMIRADEARAALGATGAGVTVAVADTGVDTDHPDLVGDIAFEECFMVSGCPAGGTHASGPGSAEDDNGHGTRVTGVVTSAGVVAPQGIADGVDIGAYKVLSSTGSGSLSDILAVLNDVILNHPEVRVVSMSLSDATNHGASCDGFFPLFTNAVATLYASKTLVVAAAGNDGFTNGLAFPACVSNVVGVSGVYDTTNSSAINTVPCSEMPRFDRVVCFGNSASTLDLLAPGALITTSGLGGGTSVSFGTSIATPHVTAAAALLWAQDPSLTSAGVESALESNGVPRTDPKSGVTTPRLDVWKALASLISDPDGDGLGGSTDNCPLHANASQTNSDRNFIDTTPPLAVDDVTWINSDNLGDACDPDDDNDGLGDVLEATGCNGGGALSPTSRDSDGDRFLDKAECVLGTDPANPASKPLIANCGATGVDADGDTLPDRVEFCFYNSSPLTSETDGDASTTGSHDGCEAASFNPDRVVNVADRGLLASAIANAALRHVNLDVNKDGGWNIGDIGLVALLAGGGKCP